MVGYPQFLAPDGAASLEAIAIGLLAETFQRDNQSITSRKSNPHSPLSG